MSKIYNSIAARFAQGDAAKFPEFSLQPLLPHDLQARKLGQRFGLSAEMSRTIAYLAFNSGVRS
jgi:hypothetical protein